MGFQIRFDRDAFKSQAATPAASLETVRYRIKNPF